MFSIWSFVALLLVPMMIGVVFPRPAEAHDGLHQQIVAVTKEIRRSPKDPELYLKRAELFRLHAEWKNAEADLLKVARLDPNLTVVHLGRGKLWLDAKQFSKARAALEKYLAKQPNSFEGVVTMARVLAKLKETDKSVKYFAEAIALAPQDSAELYLERARVFAAVGRSDDALYTLDEGIDKLGTIVILQMAAVDLEVKRGAYPPAIDRLDKLAEAMPRKETFLFRRGEILLRAGKPCDAQASLIAAQNGFDSLPIARKNVRAVRTQMHRIQALLKRPSLRNCPLARALKSNTQTLTETAW